MARRHARWRWGRVAVVAWRWIRRGQAGWWEGGRRWWRTRRRCCGRGIHMIRRHRGGVTGWHGSVGGALGLHHGLQALETFARHVGTGGGHEVV